MQRYTFYWDGVLALKLECLALACFLCIWEVSLMGFAFTTGWVTVGFLGYSMGSLLNIMSSYYYGSLMTMTLA